MGIEMFRKNLDTLGTAAGCFGVSGGLGGLSKEIGCSRNTLYNYMSSEAKEKFQSPPIYILEGLSNIFGVSIDDLWKKELEVKIKVKGEQMGEH